VKAADDAMYVSKRSGTEKVVVSEASGLDLSARNN